MSPTNHIFVQDEAVANIKDKAKVIRAAAEASGQQDVAAAAKMKETNRPVPSDKAVAIRLKLLNAISVMQEGLVERDTEVRHNPMYAITGNH